MDPIWKTAGANIFSFIIGFAMVGSCGMLMLTDSAFTSKKTSSAAAATPTAAAAETDKAEEKSTSDIEAKAADTLDAVEALSFMRFKKAAIGEYDMTAVQSKKTKKKKEELDPEDFKVPFPEDNTVIYLPERNDPLNFTETRSLTEEFYTVHDENSGSTVTMNAHELLLQMVNNEIGDSWGEEAIKAQFVAAYSHLRFNEALGLTPTVGLKSGYSSKLRSCFAQVEGQAMMYGGKIINGVYSASTAGYSTTAEDIWGVDYPYLRCVESEYDDQDPNWGIEKKYSRDEVKALLENKFSITLSDDVTKWFTVDRIYSVRYIDTVTIDGRSDCKLTGNGLCNLVGLKSNAIEIAYKDGEFTFTSYGWGHGVGMSQWGACYYAKNGWTYDQILTHYYVDATLGLSQVSASAVNRGQQSSSTSVVTSAPIGSEPTDESSTASSSTSVQQTETQPPQTSDEAPAVTTVPVQTEFSDSTGV